MRTYTNAEIADVIESEGFEYAIRDYVNADQIEDADVRAMWSDIAALMEDVRRVVFRARADAET